MMKKNKPYNRTSNEASELIKIYSQRIKAENPNISDFEVTQMALKQLRELGKIR